MYDGQVTTTAAHALQLRLRAALPIVFDGGLTSELRRLGYAPPQAIGSAAAVREVPRLIADVHRRSVAAGVHVVRANTARTTPRVLRAVGYDYRAAAITSQALDLALEAVQEARSHAAVAGVLYPLEGRESPEATPSDRALREEHDEHAARLAAGGADAIYVESMPTLREAVAATVAGVKTDLPVFTSFAVGPDLRLLSGEDLATAARAVHAAGASVVLVNGGGSLTEAERAAMVIAQAGLPWGVLPDLPARSSADRLVALCVRAVQRGAAVVGGCCSVAPEELGAVVDALIPRGRDSVDAM